MTAKLYTRRGPNTETKLPPGVRIHRIRDWWYPQVFHDGDWQNIPYMGKYRTGVYRGRFYKNVLHRARLAALLMTRDHTLTFVDAYRTTMRFALTHQDVVTGRWATIVAESIRKAEVAMNQPRREFGIPVRTTRLGSAIHFKHDEQAESPQQAAFDVVVPPADPTDMAPVEQPAEQAIEQTTFETTDAPPVGEMPMIDSPNDSRPHETRPIKPLQSVLAWLAVIAHNDACTADERRAADDALNAIDWLLKPEQQVVVVKKSAYQRPIYRVTTLTEEH